MVASKKMGPNMRRRDIPHWINSYGISERESLPKQTTNHRHLERKRHRRNSGSDSGRTGNDFPKYGAPDSILSGRKWWHFQHMLGCRHISNTMRFALFNFRCNILISGKIIKEMPGSVASGTSCIIIYVNSTKRYIFQHFSGFVQAFSSEK